MVPSEQTQLVSSVPDSPLGQFPRGEFSFLKGAATMLTNQEQAELTSFVRINFRTIDGTDQYMADSYDDLADSILTSFPWGQSTDELSEIDRCRMTQAFNILNSAMLLIQYLVAGIPVNPDTIPWECTRELARIDFRGEWTD